MRIVVTGSDGQVARSLSELGSPRLQVVTLARPVFDLGQPDRIGDLVRAARPDVVVSAAAYTAVDKAESEPELAHALNAEGAGAVAAAAASVGAPVIHLSTDYVFDGTKDGLYVEDDPVAPQGVYGASKLAGERAVAAATPDHAILRTAWVYAPFGKNFVRTMLTLAETRDQLRVVADQRGCPSYAPDIAAAIVSVARNLKDGAAPELRGVFHMAGAGETDWAAFAHAIFEGSAARGGPSASVERIATADYPTPARRPANSRLDCARLEARHGVRMPDWRDALNRCLDRLVGPAA